LFLIEQIIDEIGQAAATNDQKVSHQLPPASARLRQRKGGQLRLAL